MDFDTLGNKLTDEQKSFFKDTKIVDGDRLIACQHITSAPEFGEFDIGKSKNSSDFGIGFYFSTDDSIYKQGEGQRKLLCYLNIAKPMTEESHYIPDETWAKFVDEVWKDEKTKPTDYFAVSNKTPDAVNYRQLSDFYGGDRSYFLGCVNKVLGEIGIDGAFYRPNCIVAFKPEQIKKIDNAAPTESKNMNEALDRFFDDF